MVTGVTSPARIIERRYHQTYSQQPLKVLAGVPIGR